MNATLMDGDLHFVMARVPGDIRKLVKERGLFLAGGFIRATIAGERPSDIDLFGPTKELLELCALNLTEARKGRHHDTDNAFTVLAPPRMPVQFIHRWMYSHGIIGAAKLLSEFDFTICQAVIWWEDAKWNSMVSERFYADLAARRLYYTFPQREEDAGGSMLRVRKFLERGYHIQAGALGAVIARIAMGVRWDEIGTGESSERHAAKVITGLLRQVDPLIVIDGIEPINEHEAEEQQ